MCWDRQEEKEKRARETELNDAVTEQTAYARKKLKKELNR